MTRKLFFLIWRLSTALLGMPGEALRFVRVVFQSQASLVAENLFLRKQLAFYQERNSKPRLLTDSPRFALLFWSRWFSWRSTLVVVKPETLIGWHRLSGHDVDAWSDYFLDFVESYYDSHGKGVGSFEEEEVLVGINQVSTLEIKGYPSMVSFPGVPVDILLLDSNRRPSGSAVTNAIGYVGEDQLTEARRLVWRRSDRSRPVLIALHHHVIPVLSLQTTLLIWGDAKSVLGSAIEVGAVAIIHGHTHMPDVYRYSSGAGSILIYSCGSALFPAGGRRAKEVRFPSCFGLRVMPDGPDASIALFHNAECNKQ